MLYSCRHINSLFPILEKTVKRTFCHFLWLPTENIIRSFEKSEFENKGFTFLIHHQVKENYWNTIRLRTSYVLAVRRRKSCAVKPIEFLFTTSFYFFCAFTYSNCNLTGAEIFFFHSLYWHYLCLLDSPAAIFIFYLTKGKRYLEGEKKLFLRPYSSSYFFPFASDMK